MKEQLISLAKQRGFKSDHIDMDFFIEKKGEIFEYWFYLWMCELQKFLREKKDIDVIVTPEYNSDGYSYYLYKNKEEMFSVHSSRNVYESELEKALIDGLNLKLIK